MENNRIFYAGDVFDRTGLSYCCAADDLSTTSVCKGSATSSYAIDATSSYEMAAIATQTEVSLLDSKIDGLEARVAALETPQHKSRSNLRSALRTLNYRREV